MARKKRMTIHEVMRKVREGKRLTEHEREILARHLKKHHKRK